MQNGGILVERCAAHEGQTPSLEKSCDRKLGRDAINAYVATQSRKTFLSSAEGRSGRADVFSVSAIHKRSSQGYDGVALPRAFGRYAPQDSRTTRRGVSAKLRGGRVGSAMRSNMARKAITAMSRLG
jgi:hypothetical protein